MEWWIAISEIARNFGIIAAGAVGLVLAGMRVVAANRQAKAALEQTALARRDHVAELFNRAVGQLTDDKLEVRLGAIFTLRQIARDFPDLTEAVFELLSAYLRGSNVDYGHGEPPVDIRGIMSIVNEQLGGQG